MFFFSKGFIKSATERGTLYNNSLTNSPNKHAKIRVRNFDYPVLLRVDDIVYHNQDNIIILNVNDGESSLDVNLCPSKWNLLSNNDENKKLDKGGVIIIYEYSFEDVKLKNRDNILDMIKIIECSLVGTTTTLEKSLKDRDCAEEKISKLPINSKESTQIINYAVSQINMDLNGQNWSLRAKLIKKSLLKEFVNKLNGNNGKLMRFQVGDSTGHVELVGFNEEALKMQNCSEDKSYIFTNTEVKYAKSNMAQATDETKIELVMTKKTIIEEFLENESEISKSQEKVVEIKGKILQKLNEISQMKDGEIVSTIAVIVSIEDCKEITPKNKNPILLRNFIIADQTMQSVKVAVWGKQAEEFKFQLGNILIISKIKISQFNGVSLSVQWETALMKVEDDWKHIEEANELRNWYSNREGISNILKRKLSIQE
jgi:hypothetical protein